MWLIALSLASAWMKEKRTFEHNCAGIAYARDMRDLRQLQSFRSTALCGSVRAAAERLGYTPSAVSAQIRALERDIGFDLFVRGGRRLIVSEAGSELVAAIDEVFGAVAVLDERIADLAAARLGCLTIGYFSSAGARWLPDLVAYLENTHPASGVRLELTDGHVKPAGFEVQLVVTAERELATPSGMSSRILLADDYVAAVPTGHECTRLSAVSLAQLRALPWIDNELRDSSCRQMLIDACRSAGVEPVFRHQAHDYATALDMVDRGLGATVLPRLGLRGTREHVSVIEILTPRPVRFIHVVYVNNGPLAAMAADAVRALGDLITPG